MRAGRREEKKEGDPARGAQEKEGDEQNSGVAHPVGPDWCEIRKRAKVTEAGEASVTFFNRVLFPGSRGGLFSPGNSGDFSSDLWCRQIIGLRKYIILRCL